MSKKNTVKFLSILALIGLNISTASAAPPYDGTIFLDPDIIKSTDYSAFTHLTFNGQATRSMFDRRTDKFSDENPYLFNAHYNDGLSIEIQVNPEFGSKELAQAQAAYYAPVIGRLPHALRKDVKTSWIHKGDNLFGGGNNNILIHTGSIAQDYIRDGILEETLAHEASHTSLDPDYARAPAWISAQQKDGEFISTYARDNPTSEDVAESFVPYLGAKYRANRISKDHVKTYNKTIPNRFAFFKSKALNLYPLEATMPTGYVHLSTNFRGPDMRLDVYNGGSLNNMTHLAKTADYSGQFWKFRPTGNGWYKMTTQFRSEKVCLDIHNGGAKNNQPHLTKCDNYTGQMWRLKVIGLDKYKLVTRFRGEDMCLDIFNGGDSNNMPHLTKCAGYSGQTWSLTPAN